MHMASGSNIYKGCLISILPLCTLLPIPLQPLQFHPIPTPPYSPVFTHGMSLSLRLLAIGLIYVPASEFGSTLATKMPIFCSAPPLMINPMSSPSTSTVITLESPIGLSTPLGAA